MANDTDKSQAKTKRKLGLGEKICYALGISSTVAILYCIDMISCSVYGSKKIDNLTQHSQIVNDYTFHEKLKNRLEYNYFTSPKPRFKMANHKHTFNAIRSAFVTDEWDVLGPRFKAVYDSEFKPIVEDSIKNADYETNKIFKSASEKIDEIAQNKLIECDKKLEELASHPDIARLNALKKKYYETTNPFWMFRK